MMQVICLIVCLPFLERSTQQDSSFREESERICERMERLLRKELEEWFERLGEIVRVVIRFNTEIVYGLRRGADDQKEMNSVEQDALRTHMREKSIAFRERLKRLGEIVYTVFHLNPVIDYGLRRGADDQKGVYLVEQNISRTQRWAKTIAFREQKAYGSWKLRTMIAKTMPLVRV